VGVKLVNDLDLIVTNLDTGTVFYGNDIPAEADFTPGVIPLKGAVEPVDSVNNVENVAIRNPQRAARDVQRISLELKHLESRAVMASSMLAMTCNVRRLQPL